MRADRAVPPLWTETGELITNGQTTPVAILRGDHVALHALSLPARGARQKAAASPFALEGVIGTALEDTHIAACGAASAAGQTLAAVIGADVMAQAVASRPDTPIVAETLLLAAPPAGPEGDTTWRCLRQDDRVVVRCSDGTGFAAGAEALVPLWYLAGKPQVECFCAPLPQALLAKHQPGTPPPPLERFRRPSRSEAGAVPH